MLIAQRNRNYHLVGAEELGPPDDRLDGARLDVAHVDALRLPELDHDGLVPLHKLG